MWTRIIFLILFCFATPSHAKSFSEHCQIILTKITSLKAPPSTQEQLEQNILHATVEVEELKQNLLSDPFQFVEKFDRRVDAFEQQSKVSKSPQEIAQAIHVPEWAPIVNWVEAYLQYDLKISGIKAETKTNLKRILKFCKQVRRNGYVYAEILTLNSAFMLNQSDIDDYERSEMIPTLNNLKLHPQRPLTRPELVEEAKQKAVDMPKFDLYLPLNYSLEDIANQQILSRLEKIGFPYQIYIPLPAALTELEITLLWSAGLHPLGQAPRWVEGDFYVRNNPFEWWSHDIGHSTQFFISQLGLPLNIYFSSSVASVILSTLSKKHFRIALRSGGHKLWLYLENAKNTLNKQQFELLSYNIFVKLHETYSIHLTKIDEFLKSFKSF